MFFTDTITQELKQTIKKASSAELKLTKIDGSWKASLILYKGKDILSSIAFESIGVPVGVNIAQSAKQDFTPDKPIERMNIFISQSNFSNLSGLLKNFRVGMHFGFMVTYEYIPSVVYSENGLAENSLYLEIVKGYDHFAYCIQDQLVDIKKFYFHPPSRHTSSFIKICS